MNFLTYYFEFHTIISYFEIHGPHYLLELHYSQSPNHYFVRYSQITWICLKEAEFALSSLPKIYPHNIRHH